MKKIVLIGAGGHCKVIIDILNSMKEYEIVGVTDPKGDGKVLDVSIIGDDNILHGLHKEGVQYAFICVGAIGNMEIRNVIHASLKKIGFKLPVLIHKTAIVSNYATIDEGTCIMPGAIINPSVVIGKNCIINTGSIIEHDCWIGDNTHISPNASIAGGVSIGINSHIGIGSTIIQEKKVGDNVTIGAGAVVITDIEDNTTAVGIPARMIKVK